MSVTLREIIVELVKREEMDWADACAWLLPLDPMITHGFTFEEVLDMTIDEVEAWISTPPRPAKYEGWNYWRGSRA